MKKRIKTTKLDHLIRICKAHTKKRKGPIIVETMHQDDIQAGQQYEDLLNYLMKQEVDEVLQELIGDCEGPFPGQKLIDKE